MPEFFALSAIILLFSVVLHEVMHGVAALHFGDDTALRAGRLTLNPLPHIDPIGTIFLPLLLIISGSPFLFGWAKPVPVNPLRFRNLRQGELVVSLAGVVANLILALVAALLFHLLRGSTPTLTSTLLFANTINLVLLVFNLFPIPPLDGSKVLMSLLPPKLASSYSRLEPHGVIILLLLLLIPAGHGTLLGTILSFFVRILQSALGIS